MKKILLINAFLFFACITFGQTTAKDFTANDCAGNSHNLFAELDACKVIVIAWVMPCSSCKTEAIAAYNTVQTYATSNPEVLFYLADDYANTSCSSLESWASGNGMGEAITLSDNATDLDYYGGGMPRIVVLGGPNHEIYYSVDHSSWLGNPAWSAGGKAAIDQALADCSATGVFEQNNHTVSINSYPNPVKNMLNVSYTLDQSSEVVLEVLNILGETIVLDNSGMKNGAETYKFQAETSDWSNGVYFLKITTNDGVNTHKFIVSQ